MEAVQCDDIIIGQLGQHTFLDFVTLLFLLQKDITIF
jgi:hypothetical protein